ncbi:MAG: AmiR/NasT family two-component response regulator [Crocinitomix sp.]|jgi:AmiR/NasT family two-component response regulator
MSRISSSESYGLIVKPFQENDLKPNIDIATYNWNKRKGEKQEQVNLKMIRFLLK